MISPRNWTALIFSLPLMAEAAFSADFNPKNQQLDGVFSQNLYSSPSYAIICSFEKDIVDSSPFFIMDDFADGFESMTFGYDVADQLMIWTVRRQKIGLYIQNSAYSKGAALNQDNYISVFYKDSPYNAEILSKHPRSEGGVKGHAGVVRVNIENEAQNHGYWVGVEDGWIFSVQTLPPISSGDDLVVSREIIKEKTFEVLEACNFNTY